MNREQIIKARAAAILSKEVEKKDGWPVLVQVPSESENSVRVRLTWHDYNVETVCQCRGSRNGMCYHQLAAVLYCLRHADVSVATDKGRAKRLSRIGGYILGVCNGWSNPSVWLVVRTRNRTWVEPVDLPGELAENLA